MSVRSYLICPHLVAVNVINEIVVAHGWKQEMVWYRTFLFEQSILKTLKKYAEAMKNE